jgi:hypothetical protein
VYVPDTVERALACNGGFSLRLHRVKVCAPRRFWRRTDEVLGTACGQPRANARCSAVTNDNVVPVENSVAFYLALTKAKVPAEMHLFQSGPHGVGMALTDTSLSPWTTLLANWLRARGLLTRHTAQVP